MAWLPVVVSATRSRPSRTATASPWCRSERATSPRVCLVRGGCTLGGGDVMTSTPQDALALTTWFAPRGGYRSAFAALTRIEAIRLATHPALILGTAFGVVFTVLTFSGQGGQVLPDALGLLVVPSSVGLGAMMAAFYVTRSFHRAEELVDASPTSSTTRTATLCLTAVVPALIASLWLVLFYGFTPPPVDAPDWMYGVFSHADIAAVLVGQSVVAAVGGTLLGVAAGRWWRFRSASAVLLVGVMVCTIGWMGLLGGDADTVQAGWNRWIRLLAPVGSFTSTASDGNSVVSQTGSPWWYLAWLVTLCAVAALTALLWRSEGVTRRRVVRVGVITLALSGVTYGLAVSGGLSHQVRTFTDGHSVTMVPK